MESQLAFATKEDLWRLQEAFNDITATQAQHTDRIMRLERRKDDDGRVRNVWGPNSPFTNALGSSQQESGLNPAAEAFRNFDAEPASGMMSSLTLDAPDDSRRVAASRANSVRFDESANNHYTPSSRQSIDLPTRTGSGLGSHPMSERSLSHRSDGRASNSGFLHRTNSFGLEQSRLLGSINNSPRVSANPAPGFFVLGPCPAIIRCWLTEAFTNDSLLYAAVCTGSHSSSVGSPLIQRLGLGDQTFEENGLRKIKLSVYLTEAKVHQSSSRSASPGIQVPTVTAKFIILEAASQDKSIQIVLGSDVLRAHNADVLLSQDRLMIYDEGRNQLMVPLIRPEDDAVYNSLSTASAKLRNVHQSSSTMHVEPVSLPNSPGIIGRPGRIATDQTATSPTMASPSALTSAALSDAGDTRRHELSSEGITRTSTEQSRPNEDARSVTGSDKSFSGAVSKPNSGVWATSWRAGSSTVPADTSANKTASAYSRASAPRNMKVLRPSKSITTASRATSSSTPYTNGGENMPLKALETDRNVGASSATEPKSASGPSKSNPVGSASAFGWLNSSQQKRSVANGE